MTRPMIRKRHGWWLVFAGRSTWRITDRRYTSAATAHDAAVRLAAKGALR